MKFYRINTGGLRTTTNFGIPILVTEELYRKHNIGRLGYVFGVGPHEMFAKRIDRFPGTLSKF